MSVRGEAAQILEAQSRMGADVLDVIRQAVEQGVPLREWLLCKTVPGPMSGMGRWSFDLLGWTLAEAEVGDRISGIFLRFRSALRPGWSSSTNVWPTDVVSSVNHFAKDVVWQAMGLEFRRRNPEFRLRVVHEQTGEFL